MYITLNIAYLNKMDLLTTHICMVLLLIYNCTIITAQYIQNMLVICIWCIYDVYNIYIYICIYIYIYIYMHIYMHIYLVKRRTESVSISPSGVPFIGNE